MCKVKKSYLIDMDGVLVHGSRPIPGAKGFIQSLLELQQFGAETRTQRRDKPQIVSGQPATFVNSHSNLR